MIDTRPQGRVMQQPLTFKLGSRGERGFLPNGQIKYRGSPTGLLNFDGLLYWSDA